MGVDDRAADMQTIKHLRDRLSAMASIKDSLLAENRELTEQISELKKLISSLDYERACIMVDLHHLRNELDKHMK